MEIIRRGRKPDSIPDKAYRREAEEKALRKQGWDEDRALNHIRQRVVEDKQGRKQVDLRK